MDFLLKWRNSLAKTQKQMVSDYKNTISDFEKETELFYKHRFERDEISRAEYAQSLKERYERYVQHSKDVLDVDFMTEEEKAEISKQYLRESEEALTAYYKNIRKIEEDAEKERQAAEKERMDEKKAAREELNKLNDASVNYVSDRNYHSDWAEMGDDPLSAYQRVNQRLSDSADKGDISYEEYSERISGFGSFMYNDRISNSNRWLESEREMNRITAEEYIDGLQRMMDYTQEYYSSGIISHRQYLDGMRSLEERLFAERKNQHKKVLKQAEEEKDAVDELAQSKIDALEKEYNASLNALDESKREDELAELKAQERIYANSQTKEGKDRLAQIREDIEDINEEKRRAELKEDFTQSKEEILEAAELKKSRIDKRAVSSALDFGLYYDEEQGYRMISSVNSTLSGVLSEQSAFSEKSRTEMTLYNTELSNQMIESAKSVASGILEQFQAFSAGINAIKNQIFADVNSVNSLDFSRFGVSGKTTITYNDYGDKNISGGNYSSLLYDNLKTLAAKGGRL